MTVYYLWWDALNSLEMSDHSVALMATLAYLLPPLAIENH